MWGPHKERKPTSRDTIELFLREGDDTLPKYEQKKKPATSSTVYVFFVEVFLASILTPYTE
jgi:hypothetical protein